MNNSNYYDAGLVHLYETAEQSHHERLSHLPKELIDQHVALYTKSLDCIGTHVNKIKDSDDVYDIQLIKTLNAHSFDSSVQNTSQLADAIPIDLIHHNQTNSIALLVAHKQAEINLVDKRFSYFAERLSHFTVAIESQGREFALYKFLQDNINDFPQSPRLLDQLLKDQAPLYINDSEPLPIEAGRESYWRYMIDQSSSRSLMKDEDVDLFIKTLKDQEAEFSKSPEFYIHVFGSNGIAASKAGNLVNLYNNKPTGFFNAETNRREGTAGDMVKQALLQILPSNIGENAEFGTYFEFAAKAAFEADYEKTHGVKLQSRLSAPMRRALLRCENIYPYKAGLDEFYYDPVNDKTILAEFKMPSMLNGSYEKSTGQLTLLDDHRYQTNLYQSVIYFVTGKLPDDSIVFQFGMDGLMDMLPLMKDEKSKSQIKNMVTSQVVACINSGSKMVRCKKNYIKPDSNLVKNVLVPSAKHWQEGYLKLGISPEEPISEKETLGVELFPVEQKLTQHAINKEIADQVDRQNKKIIKRMNEIKIALDVDVIKGECAATTKSSRQPPPAVIYDRALSAGLNIDYQEISDVIETSDVKIDPAKLTQLAKEHNFDEEQFKTLTHIVKLNKDYHFKSNVKPKMESMVRQIVKQSQTLSEALDKTNKVDVRVDQSVKENQAPNAEGLGYSSTAPSMQ